MNRDYNAKKQGLFGPFFVKKGQHGPEETVVLVTCARYCAKPYILKLECVSKSKSTVSAPESYSLPFFTTRILSEGCYLVPFMLIH